MTRKPSGIRYISGRRNLLIVSPHGPFIKGVFENDVRTGIIAEKLERLVVAHTLKGSLNR